MPEANIVEVKAEWCDLMRLIQRAQLRVNELSNFIARYEADAAAAPPPEVPEA